MARRALPCIILLAAALHLLGMARAPLPAQDGLKFIRIARQFHHQPWTDVVRGADQHPLYPALIALAQPAVAVAIGPGPDSWRIAAQGVSALSALALIIPLFGLARLAFDERIAMLAVLLYVLLPLPAEVGHDTLADALALLCFVLAFRLGAATLRSGGLAAPIGCGIAAGAGFLARPEVLLVPVAVAIAALTRWRRFLPLPVGETNWGDGFGVRVATLRAGGTGNASSVRPAGPFAAMAVATLVMVGAYALAKGEVSEKLSLRIAAGVGGRSTPVPDRPHGLPPGLDDPRWDFSPKEESDHPGHWGMATALRRLLGGWAEGLGWILAPLAVWGAWRGPRSERGGAARRLAAVYLLLFGAVLIRHAMALGYLSGRHTLTMVLVMMPWVAAGALALGRGIAGRFGWDGARRRRLGRLCLATMIVAGTVLQAKPGHPSRWGHLAAGRWLAEHAGAADAVLDTRGWAAFVSGRASYDYWHVRQALTDARLAFIVVGTDELTAPSRRAATLRAVLAFAATPAVSFPERRGGQGVGVQVFRFHRPSTWEALRP